MSKPELFAPPLMSPALNAWSATSFFSLAVASFAAVVNGCVGVDILGYKRGNYALPESHVTSRDCIHSARFGISAVSNIQKESIDCSFATNCT